MAGWEPMCRYYILGGLCASTHTWKTLMEHAQSDILSTYSPRPGGVKGATGVPFSDIGGVGRDEIIFNLDAPPVALPETLIVEIGGHAMFYFVGWAVLLLTFDGVVRGWSTPHKFYPLGGLATS